jgi:hypothetical protein
MEGVYPRTFRQNFDMDVTWKVTIQRWKDYTKMDFDLLLLNTFVLYAMCWVFSLPQPGTMHLKFLPFWSYCLNWNHNQGMTFSLQDIQKYSRCGH